MNILTKIKNIQKLNEEELKNNISYKGSWHYKYKDSPYIFISNLPKETTEGDLSIVFSEYGEIMDCRIIHDKEGNSRCFAFLCYENIESTILAVDNLNGIKIGKNNILVDHILEYKIPKIYENNYQLTGPDGRGWGKERETTKDEKEKYNKIVNDKLSYNNL